jgi:hypothetical protein
MVGSAAGVRRLSGLVGGLVLAAAFAAPAAAASGDGVAAAPARRVRAMDARAGALLAEGAARSATFRQLVERIEQSDLLVYVKVARLDHRGKVQFVAATPSCRVLSVTVRVPGLLDDLPYLAHELQHAVEIASAPEVRDEAGLLLLYQRIGHGSRVGSTMEMETTAAQMITVKVWEELTGTAGGR